MSVLKQTFVYFIDSRYITVLYNTTIRTEQQLQCQTSARLRTQERHAVPCPHGRAMACLS